MFEISSAANVLLISALGFAIYWVGFYQARKTQREHYRDFETIILKSTEEGHEAAVQRVRRGNSVGRPFYPARDENRDWYPAGVPELEKIYGIKEQRPNLPMRNGTETAAACDALNDAFKAGWTQCARLVANASRMD